MAGGIETAKDLLPEFGSSTVGRFTSAQADATDAMLLLAGIVSAALNLIQLSANGFVEAALIGSYHFYFTDPAALFLGLVIFRRLNHLKYSSVVSTLVLIYCAVQAVYLFRGILISPFNAATSFRYAAQFPAFLLLFALLLPTTFKIVRLERIFVFTTLALLALYIGRMLFGVTFLLQDRSMETDFSFLEIDRYLNAEAAIFLGGCSLYFFELSASTADKERQRRLLLLAFTAFMLVILSRVRSASLATVCGWLAYAALSKEFWRLIPRWVQRTVLILCACITLAYFTGGLDSLADLIPSKFLDTYKNTGTLTARQYFWFASFQEFQSRSLVDMLIGHYAGRPTMLVLPNGDVWETSLHSQFVQTLYNFGFIGVVSFLLLIMSAAFSAIRQMRNKHRVKNAIGMTPNLALAWIVMMCVFGWAYEWMAIGSIFFALACAPWPKQKGAEALKLSSRISG